MKFYFFRKKTFDMTKGSTLNVVVERFDVSSGEQSNRDAGLRFEILSDNSKSNVFDGLSSMRQTGN